MSSSSDSESGKKKPVQKKLCLEGIKQECVILKVPNHVSEALDNLPTKTTIGTMKIEECADGKTKMLLNFAPEVCAYKGKREVVVEHELRVLPASKSEHAIISHSNPEKFHSLENIDNYRITNLAVQMLDLRQVHGFTYINPLPESIREIKKIDFFVDNYLPCNNHIENIEYRAIKKARGKRFRDDKEFVQSIIVSAFAHEPFYHFKELLHITNQSKSYLKECLVGVADISKDLPGRCYWKLKPEFQACANYSEIEMSDYCRDYKIKKKKSKKRRHCNLLSDSDEY